MNVKISGVGRRAATIALLAAVAWPQVASAQSQLPLSYRNAFRLGDAGVLCTAQSKPTDPRLAGIFDRAYLLTCRDAASPVGSLIARSPRRRPRDRAERDSHRNADVQRRATAMIEGVGTVRSLACRDETAKLDYRRYAVNRGKTSYLVEGPGRLRSGAAPGAGVGGHRPCATG